MANPVNHIRLCKCNCGWCRKAFGGARGKALNLDRDEGAGIRESPEAKWVKYARPICKRKVFADPNSRANISLEVEAAMAEPTALSPHFPRKSVAVAYRSGSQ